jgi:hypothetical protein
MSLFNLVVILVLIGLGLYGINRFIPMDPKIKNILNIVVVIAVVLWLLSVFGILPNMANIRVGR